jgi:hypothetical protein
MDYASFTNSSLAMMYEAVRGALAADDAAEEQGNEPPFQIRTTGAWMTHVADLEYHRPLSLQRNFIIGREIKSRQFPQSRARGAMKRGRKCPSSRAFRPFRTAKTCAWIREIGKPEQGIFQTAAGKIIE